MGALQVSRQMERSLTRPLCPTVPGRPPWTLFRSATTTHGSTWCAACSAGAAQRRNTSWTWHACSCSVGSAMNMCRGAVLQPDHRRGCGAAHD